MNYGHSHKTVENVRRKSDGVGRAKLSEALSREGVDGAWRAPLPV